MFGALVGCGDLEAWSLVCDGAAMATVVVAGIATVSSILLGVRQLVQLERNMRLQLSAADQHVLRRGKADRHFVLLRFQHSNFDS
jgi:hypothetical protein